MNANLEKISSISPGSQNLQYATTFLRANFTAHFRFKIRSYLVLKMNSYVGLYFVTIIKNLYN